MRLIEKINIAVKKINPNAVFSVVVSSDDSWDITWLEDTVSISKSDIEAKINETEYQRDRAIAYPELKEQLDLLYKDMAADKGDKTGEWFKVVKKIKDDNPKE